MESINPADIIQPVKLPAAVSVKPFPLAIDTREPGTTHPWEPYLAPFTTKRLCLPFGDVTICGGGFEREVIFERKTLPDLVACCGRERERFSKCVTGLLGHRLPFLVVEATWADLEAGQWLGDLKPSHVIGSVVGWQCRGLHVIPAGDAPRAGRIVARIAYTIIRRAWSTARDLLAAALDTEGSP